MKLVMTKGLPGSGKSTWAKEQLKKGNWKRVNKDDLRRMLDDGKWSSKNEKFVLEIRNQIVKDALYDGYNVIVDDTNLHPKHEERLRLLVQDLRTDHGKIAKFEVKDFTDVPIEKCIENDLKRFDSVGEKVIRKMYKDFLAPKPEKPKWDLALLSAIICDIDGTLALFGDRNPYDRDFENDEVNNPVYDIISKYAYDESYANGAGYPIILLSGREGKFRSITEQWLYQNGIPHNALFMRTEGDVRNDAIVKEELYREHIEGKFNVLFVLDDRDRVVDLWRRLGLTCLQVADGDF